MIDVRICSYHHAYSVMYVLTPKAKRWASEAHVLGYNVMMLGRGIIVPTTIVEIVKAELVHDGLTLAEGHDA